jgi:hypothetical protein
MRPRFDVRRRMVAQDGCVVPADSSVITGKCLASARPPVGVVRDSEAIPSRPNAGCTSGLRREVPLVVPVGQNRPQRLPVDDGVEADALR